ncbi:hypothetical protein [Streptomyces sp. NPDC002215]|uniref:hypothetical protein n=1 Tax=Streptomyces sp. NPDC002215 TaxID=3154412 RepID=UPI003325F981
MRTDTPSATTRGRSLPDSACAPHPLDVGHVPYIALTKGEKCLATPDLVVGRDGWIEYRQPGPWDRHPHYEVLLARTVGTPSGRPDGNQLSPHRQFHCQDGLLCQGCAAPAARNPASRPAVLWVLPATNPDGSPAGFTGHSDMPPSCARCALHRCPVLKERGSRYLWVAECDAVAVWADLYLPPKGTRATERLVPLTDERRLSAAVATRLVRDLREVTEADRGQIEELAAAQSPAAVRGGSAQMAGWH